MPDGGAASMSRAAKLARWTRLTGAKLRDCYVNVRIPGCAADWPVIVGKQGAASGKDEALKLEVCRQAEAGGFLDTLARAVANWENRAGRPDAEILQMLDEVVAYGVMQGMNNQQKGFMSAEILLPLLQARDACAIIFETSPVRNQLGTGFLVRPDLVLTAAHVVMEVEQPPGAQQRWLPKLKPGLAFEFRARPNQPQNQRVEVLAAADQPLVSFALPYGKPPDQLDISLTPPEGPAAQLDYALIRLAQRVEHLLPVEIADSAAVEEGKPCWAFGYPGGSALMMDVDLVEEVSTPAGRWLHKTNAARGMSGGCCINHAGQVAGLHEGTFKIVKGGSPLTLNRGVCIGAIRQMQRRQGRDPLDAATGAPGLEIHDRQLIEELYRSGLRLGGEAIAPVWREQVRAALKGDVEDGSFTSTFHPWFARDCVEKWIESSDPAERLCIAYGADGTGKSFCARILRERRDPTGVDFLALTPTQVNAMSWTDAISNVLVPEGSQYRTTAAAIRYRDFEEVIEELRKRSAGGTRNFYVAIDFGPVRSEGRFAGTQWVEFIAALTAQDWMRVLLIDLDPFERATMLDRLASKSETQDIAVTECEIQPITRNEFLAYARKLAKARGSPISESDLRALADRVLPATLDFSGAAPGLQTASTALAAIVLEGALR